MTRPLRITFDLRCAAEHAFAVWTTRTSMWWPADHTVSGEPDVDVVIEPTVGGRIFERTPSGRESDWGEVTEWDPPRALGYRWHIGRGPEEATDVRIVFVDRGDGTSGVEIEHAGWDRFGTDADPRKDANRIGWSSLLPHFVEACR